MDNQGDTNHEVLNFVPNEICVVLVLDDTARLSQDLYNRVLVHLRDALVGLREEPEGYLRRALEELKVPDALRGGLEQDLLLTRFWKDFRSQSDRFALRPLQQSRLKGVGRSWVALTPGGDDRGARTMALHIYQLSPDRELPSVTREDRDRTLALVNLLNLALKPELDARLAALGVRDVVVTPNWLTAAAQHTEAGPGAKPTKVQAVPGQGRWTFRHRNSKLPGPPAEASRATVVVAVLDTSPTREEVEKAAGRPGCDQNTLLQEVVQEMATGNVVIDAPGSGIPRDYLDRFTPGWQDPADRNTPPKIPDHGLFAAGIVRDIAPKAQIRLIRVLNDYGVGDMLAITHFLSTLQRRVLYDEHNRPIDDRRLVVNLSLGADIPPGRQFVAEYFPETYKVLQSDPEFANAPDLQAVLTRMFPRLWDYLNRLHVGLLQALTRDGRLKGRMLVIAAAGNDRQQLVRALYPPEPRWPARYDGVLGVAAVKRSNTPADFSNRGDVKELYNGVATFGGNANAQGTIVVPRDESQTDAVRGLFISEENSANACWAYWSGTSFATPIISAIVANVWAANPGLSADQLVKWVRNLATVHGTEGPDELDCPTIAATQEWV